MVQCPVLGAGRDGAQHLDGFGLRWFRICRRRFRAGGLRRRGPQPGRGGRRGRFAGAARPGGRRRCGSRQRGLRRDREHAVRPGGIVQWMVQVEHGELVLLRQR